jgi:hypothetical protein
MVNRDSLFQSIDETFSSKRACELATELTGYYRMPGSDDFRAAMEMIETEFRETGMQVNVDRPVEEDIWEPKAAELSIVEPDHIPIVDFETASTSLAAGSSGTDGTEQIEVVDVGTGEDPSDFVEPPVDGKAVFIHGTKRRLGWREAARNAAKAGATGIITDYMLFQTPGVREPELIPEATQFLRLRPQELFIDNNVWAFSIPNESSKNLQKLLAEGSVTVEVSVDAEFQDAELPYVEATIDGTEHPDETVLLCGHASGTRPGGNCAEGAGVVMELARTLHSLAESETIEPRRTIKFIMGAEVMLPKYYLKKHPNAPEDVVTALTYCSAGHNQTETRSCLLLSNSPDSVPHYINDYLAELAEQVPKEANWIGKERGQELPLLAFKQHYFTPWSDNKRFAPAGIPSPLFMSWPDRCFHSQLLTEEVIDPNALRRSGLISGVAAAELAVADTKEAESIARIVAGRSINRISRITANTDLDDATDRDDRRLSYVAERDIEALRSTAELTNSELPVLDELIDQIRTVVESHQSVLHPSDTRTEQPALAHMIPVQTTDDDIVDLWSGLEYQEVKSIANRLGKNDEDAGWRSLRIVALEAWNFVDGKRTVGGIADAIGFEFDLYIEPEPVYRILAGHASAGNLKFREP